MGGESYGSEPATPRPRQQRLATGKIGGLFNRVNPDLKDGLGKIGIMDAFTPVFRDCLIVPQGTSY